MAHPDRLPKSLARASAIPSALRAHLGRNPARLRPGEVAVLQRFFDYLRRHRLPLTCPPRAAFDASAKSEPTLATLLTSLERHVPGMNLAEGRDARAAWYRRRSAGGPGRRKRAPLPAQPPTGWPDDWRAGYARLCGQCRESTARRHIATLNRCADEIAQGGLLPIVDRFTALQLARAFTGQHLSPRTVRNYIGSFLRLAKALELPDEQVAGIADVMAVWCTRAQHAPKARTQKIHDWTDGGNSWRGSLDKAAAELDRLCAKGLGWRSGTRRALRRVAVLLIVLNTAARIGDVARWRIGIELQRGEDGRWSLSYHQEKTGGLQIFSALFPEVDRALDVLLLDGRPPETLPARYTALRGRCWIRHNADRVPTRYVGTLVPEIADLPAHALRTVAADVLRRIAPETATRRTAALLGHRDPRSQQDYRAAAEGAHITERWGKVRKTLRGKGRI